MRFVLTVADYGSVSAAARLLGVNHATVLRRVAAFEAAHGGAVFEKTATGYRVLPDRARVIEAAREVENAVVSVDRLMRGARAPLSGVVRVSSTDTLCQIVLPDLAADLHASSAELRIELMSNNSQVDFSRLQADISVRPAVALPDDMTGDTCAELGFGVYAVEGAPATWLGLTGPLARSMPAAWMAANVAPEEFSGSADSFLVLREMARRGMGRAVLPRFAGDTVPGLQQIQTAMPAMTVPIWVATHSELRDVPRIRVVRQRIMAYLASRPELAS